MSTVLAVVAAIGWIGVAVQLVAYARLSSGRLEPGSVSYQGLNVSGALAVGASSAASGAWPSAVANVIWVGIGVTAICVLRRHLLERRLLAARRRALRLAEKRFRRASRPTVLSPAGTTVDASTAETLETGAERAASTGPTRPGERTRRRRRRPRPRRPGTRAEGTRRAGEGPPRHQPPPRASVRAEPSPIRIL